MCQWPEPEESSEPELFRQLQRKRTEMQLKVEEELQIILLSKIRLNIQGFSSLAIPFIFLQIFHYIFDQITVPSELSPKFQQYHEKDQSLLNDISIYYIFCRFQREKKFISSPTVLVPVYFQ